MQGSSYKKKYIKFFRSPERYCETAGEDGGKRWRRRRPGQGHQGQLCQDASRDHDN